MVFTHLPLRRSIPAGIAAYITGYVITVVVTRGVTPAVMAVTVAGRYADRSTLGEVFGAPPPHPVLAGWLFYNAQLVPTSVPTADVMNGLALLTNRSLLLAVGGWWLLLALVPAAVIVLSGYITVRTGQVHGVRGDTFGGASVAAGYLPMLVIGAFLLTTDVPNSAAVASPSGFISIFVGLVYAGLLGGLGGGLAGRLD